MFSGERSRKIGCLRNSLAWRTIGVKVIDDDAWLKLTGR